MIAQNAGRSRGGTVAGRGQDEQLSVASNLSDILSAWRLVYQVYVRTGLIDPNPHRVHTHAEVLHAGTAVIVGKRGRTITSTISSYADGPDGLPLDASCGDDLARLRDEGRTLAEIGLLADAARPGTRSSSSLLKLMRYGVFHAAHTGASDIVIGVHPHHADFYRRILGFFDFAAPTPCRRVKDHPMVPLRLEVERQLWGPPRQKGLAFFRAHELGPEVFASRLPLDAQLTARTAIGRYLSYQAELAEDQPSWSTATTTRADDQLKPAEAA